jgi:inorganic pyrophosphatase
MCLAAAPKRPIFPITSRLRCHLEAIATKLLRAQPFSVRLRMNHADRRHRSPFRASSAAPELEVVIEVPRGSFLKRSSMGRVDFISPLPCPFNYGSVPDYLGLEGDLLDAVVLGPRLPFGSLVRVRARGAVILTDRGMTDDKLICADRPLDAAERIRVLRFFRFYARCKGLLNAWRNRPGRNDCDGWCEAREALARARPRNDMWRGPSIEF